MSMALVKTTKLAGPAKRRNPPKEIQPIGSHAAPRGRLRKPVKAAAKDKVSERVAAATEELAGGLTEAAAAAEELRRSMKKRPAPRRSNWQR
jgi:methyl-accepting chemotaxis protein